MRNTVKKQKSRKAFTYADFRHFTKTQNRVDFAFDHSLSHFHAKDQNLISYRGVAELVPHFIWDEGIARSSRVTPTIFAVLTANQSRKGNLAVLLIYCCLYGIVYYEVILCIV